MGFLVPLGAAISANAVPIGLGLTAAGTAVGMAGAAKSQRAANNALLSQLAKQENFQRQASPVYAESLRQSSPDAVAEQLSGGQQTAQALYSRLNSEQLPASALAIEPQDKLNVVNSVQQRQQPAALLQGLAAYNNQQALKNSEAQTGLGVVSGLSRGSAANSQGLMQLAAQSGAGMSSVGSLMSTAGMLAGLYGAVRPAGSLPPAGTTVSGGQSHAPKPWLNG